MRIEKKYRKLEDTEEVDIYDIKESELFTYVPQEFEIPFIPFENTLNNMSNDLDIFIPYNNGEDFIVQRLGLSALVRGHIKQSDVGGRLLSKTSPGFYKVLQEPLREVYETHKTKKKLTLITISQYFLIFS